MSDKIELLIEATDNASSVLGGIGKALGGIGDIAKGVFVGGILGKGLDLLGGAISGVKDAMIGGNAEFERYQTQFGVLMGGADKAKERLNMLAEFGAKTPFELPELVKADKVLLSFGLHSDTTAQKFGVSGEQILTTIGDIAAGTGVGFEELSLTFGKFASGATGEAISRFQELGIATREQMASWGLEFSKAGQLLTPVDKAFGILEQNVRKKFGGMMDAQSQTFEGMVSNFQDWLGQVGRMLGAPIFDALKENLGGLLAFLGSDSVKGAISGMAAGMATGITNIINGIKNFAAVVGPAVMPVIGFFTTLSDSLKIFKDPLDALRQALITTFPPDTWTTINTGIEALKTLRTFIDSLILGFTTFKDPLDAVKQAFLTAFGPEISVPVVAFLTSIQTVFSTISGAVTAVLPTLLSFGASVGALFVAELPLAITLFTSAWNTITTVVTTVINAVKSIISTWAPVVQTALAGITAFLTTHGAEIQLLIGTAWNAITTIIQTAITTVTTIINALAPVVNQIFGAISTFLNAHGSEILGFLTGAWNSISAIVSGVAAIIQKVVTTVFGAVASFIKNHGDQIQTVLTGAWNFIKTTVGGALDIIKGLVNAALAIVNGDWDTAWKSLESVTKASNDIIKSLIDTAMKLIEKVIKLAVDNFKLGWENGWQLMQKATDTAMMLIKDAINTGIETAKTIIANGVEAFLGKFRDLRDKMSTIGQQLLEGMVQGIRDKVGWLVDEGIRAANAVLTAIKNTLGVKSPSDETIDVAAYLMKGGAIGVKENAYLWVDEATNVANDLIYTFDNGLNTVLTNSQIAFKRIAQTVTPILQLADTADSVTIRIENSAQSMASAVSASMAATSNSISKTASELGQFAQSGGVGGITGGTYTPSQAFQDSFRNQPTIAPPRPSSVPKPTITNNVPINITITGGNVDRYAVEDGTTDALRRAGLLGRFS